MRHHCKVAEKSPVPIEPTQVVEIDPVIETLQADVTIKYGSKRRRSQSALHGNEELFVEGVAQAVTSYMLSPNGEGRIKGDKTVINMHSFVRGHVSQVRNKIMSIFTSI